MSDVYSDRNSKFLAENIVYPNKGTKDLAKDIDTEAIKNSVRNILMTNKTERRMMPEFGASLSQLLFEPMDERTAKKLGSLIYDELSYWEPRIKITKLDVQADEDNGSYDINIEYSVLSASINTDRISFVLQG
jgi:phage baseplate assembly protein W